MGYVIAAIIVLLLVAGFITFLVLNATRRSGKAGPSDPGAEGTPAGIAAPDQTPLGDSAEHAEDTAGHAADEGSGQTDAPRVGDPGPEATAGDSERLADRRR
jgi:hypothetical protein